MLSDRARRRSVPRLRGAVIALFLIGASAAFGAVGGREGLKALIGVVLLFAGITAWLAVRDRELLVLAGLPLSIGFLLHKSIGTRALDINGGAPAIYITTTGVVLLVLVGFWIVRRHSVLDDIYDAYSDEPVLWAPVVGALLMLPSLLVTSEPGLAWAELVRMVWMYAMFVYVAARIRRRAQVWVLLGAFGALAAFEAAVVGAQWVTKSTLGLGFLGLPPQLGERIISDSGQVLRPFGTITHPVFMAAVMGALAVMALSVAIHVPNTRIRVASLLVFVAAAGSIGIAEARAGALALVVAVVVLVVASIRRRRLALATVAKISLGLLLVVGIASPWLYSQYRNNFATSHFSLEVTSRVQLNTVALQMWADHPFVGTGLNSFQREMGRYDRLGLIFAGNPVHNLYLLQAAETGVLGLIGLLLVGVALLMAAMQLAKSTDRLYSAVGYGFSVVIVFFAVQELLLFALREDQPLTLWWLLAGLMVACRRQARLAGALAEPKRRYRSLARRRGSRRKPERTVEPRDVPALVGVSRPGGNGATAHLHPSTRPRHSRDRKARGRSRWYRGHGQTICSTLRSASVFFVAAAVIVAPIPGGHTVAEADPGATRITFTAVDRVTDVSSIYTANGDGSDVVRVTNPADGWQYLWAEWAMGTSKIVFSARKGAEGQPENIFEMNSDGTGRKQLTFGSWPSAQPRVSPDGRTLLFTSLRPGWNLSAIYKLDLDTLQITNLSAALPAPNHFDADPRWSPDGSRIIFAHGEARGTAEVAVNQIWTMAPDGTDRKRISPDSYYDVDPMFSPDGSRVVFSSYRGTGGPQVRQPLNQFQAKLQDWQLTLLNPANGKETELTKGLSCFKLPESDPCAPAQTSGFVGTWSPDGNAVAFIGVLSDTDVCICSVDPTGGQGKAIVQFTDRVVTWFDWARGAPAPPTAVTAFGADAPKSEMLITATAGGTTPAALDTSSPDLWDPTQLKVPGGLIAQGGRFTPDRSHIVFAANDTGAEAASPPKPPGGPVSLHYTLPSLRSFLYDGLGAVPASTQVFMVDSTGKHLVRLTTPTTEDPRDALAIGETRANTEPDVSPDGTEVVFANVAPATGESAILRLDLKTGQVLSLTNATAGAVPVADREPRWSPDGKHVAFTTSVGTDMQIAVVNADGTGYRQITDDTYFNIAPAWSPDGQSLVYASYRGPGKDSDGNTIDPLHTNGWSLVRVDLRTGAETVLWQAPTGPILGPVWAPDGSAIAFVGTVAPGLPLSVYRYDLGSGQLSAVQLNDDRADFAVDWR